MAEGYKAWNSGDILNAADLNDYASSQAVMRFANAAGRDAALTSLIVKEGMVAYLKDSNILTVNTDGTTSGWREVSPAEASSIKDGAVTLAKLASNSVDSSKIVDGSIVDGDIAVGTIGSDKLVASAAWTAGTPVWTATGAVSLTGGSTIRYWTLGKIVHMNLDVTAAAPNTGGGVWRFTIATGTIKGIAVGSAMVYTTASTGWAGLTAFGENGNNYLEVYLANGTQQVPQFRNINTGDRIVISCTYEAN